MSVKCYKTTGLLRKVEHLDNNLEIIFLLNPFTQNVFFLICLLILLNQQCMLELNE